MADVYAALMDQVLDLPQRQGKRIYIITARRITSGDVLKYRNGFLIRRGYETHLTGSSYFALTSPIATL